MVQTRNYLATSGFLIRQSSSNQFNTTPNFFKTASNATLREAILGITCLTDENQESINFKLLLDMLENHPQLLKQSPVEARTLVESNRLRLASLDSLLKDLRQVRDRELAHLDRKHLSEPGVLTFEPIEYQDLIHCMEILTVILSDIWQALLGVPLPEHREDGQILEELDTLWKMIETHTEKVGHRE